MVTLRGLPGVPLDCAAIHAETTPRRLAIGSRNHEETVAKSIISNRPGNDAGDFGKLPCPRKRRAQSANGRKRFLSVFGVSKCF